MAGYAPLLRVPGFPRGELILEEARNEFLIVDRNFRECDACSFVADAVKDLALAVDGG